MFGYWCIVLSSANQLFRIYYNQDISKEPIVTGTPENDAGKIEYNSVVKVEDPYIEADFRFLLVTMVDKSDGKIYCVDNVFKSGAPAEHEIVIQNRKNPHDKVRK